VPNFIKVEGHDGLVRDELTHAIINTNNSEYTSYINKKKKLNEEKEKSLRQQEEIDMIKNDISDIKRLINILIERG
jgi:hypothetical protein